jgi:hypothetical protein
LWVFVKSLARIHVEPRDSVLEITHDSAALC